MNVFKGILVGLAVIIVMISLSFLFGWVDVQYIKTIGKAKQNAQREVFEQTQSYVEGKRQEVSKLYVEYLRGDEDDKKIIVNQVRNVMANVTDLDKMFGSNTELKTFVENCMRGKLTESKEFNF